MHKLFACPSSNLELNQFVQTNPKHNYLTRPPCSTLRVSSWPENNFIPQETIISDWTGGKQFICIEVGQKLKHFFNGLWKVSWPQT